jgi:hypothetical protein
MLHSFKDASWPRIGRAPSFRFSGKRSREAAKTSSTNCLLPMTAPSVK